MGKVLRKSTLLFLLREDSILLAMKKRGFGKGKLNGVGGKVDGDETPEEAAVRECEEEVEVSPLVFKKVAILDFFFPKDKPDWNQQVHVFFCTEWSGEPMETEEMRPIWHKLDMIPYDKMWPDDIFWLPKALDRNFINATFEFDSNEDIKNYKLSSEPLASD